MKGNFHVRFLEEAEGVISPPYSATQISPMLVIQYKLQSNLFIFF